MTFGTGTWGEGAWGGAWFGGGAGPYLASSVPANGSSSNTANAALSFVVDSEATVDPDSLKVYVDGKLAINPGQAFQTGFSGTITSIGEAVEVVFTTHPSFVHKEVSVVIFATDSVPLSNWMSFVFLVVLDGVLNLRTKTWCDGKRIDLAFTPDTGLHRIKIRRSKYAYCNFITDPGEDIYDGQPINLNESAFMTSFVDGAFTSTVIRTTNKDLEEDTFYYYSFFYSHVAQNFLRHSNAFDNAVWTKTNSSITPDTVQGPVILGNTATIADALVDTVANTAHTVSQTAIPPTYTPARATFSVYAKKAAVDWIRVSYDNGISGSAWFNLNAGTIGTVQGTEVTASIENIGNGWYRCAISFNPKIFVVDPGLVVIYATTGDLVSSYLGAGTAAVYLFNAQINTGNAFARFFETTTTALTGDHVWLTDPTAQVEGLSIKDYFARHGDYVYNLLPRTYRDRDSDPNRGTDRYKLKDYCRVLQCGVNLQRGWIEGLGHLRDPDTMPAGRLGEAENQSGILAAQSWDLGMPPERSFDAGVLRRIALGIVPVFKKKGSCQGLIDLAKLFAGWDVRCDEQIEPLCGVNRIFQIYDQESYILHHVTVNSANQGEGYYLAADTTLADGVTNFEVPLTDSGEPTAKFAIDALGTFACIARVDPDNLTFTDAGKLIFEDPGARLRAEITGSGTAPSPGQFNIESVNFLTNVKDGWPWQFPSAEPRFAKDAFKGLKLMDNTGAEFVIATNNETDILGDTLVTVEAPGVPAAGVFAIAYDFNGVTYAARNSVYFVKVYVGDFSLTWNPIWDIRLRQEGYPSPWSDIAGLGSINSYVSANSPANVVLWAGDVHELLGTIGSVTTSTLVDSTQAWAVGQWTDFYLLPNWGQTKLYRIVSNTATELIVHVEGGGLDTVTASGLRYVILSKENALKYQRLTKLLPSFIPHESIGIVKFEAAFVPTDVAGLLQEYRSDRGIVFGTFPAVQTWIDGAGGDNNTSQFMASQRPTFVTNEGDNQTALVFDGTDDYYNTQGTPALDAIASGSYTIFVVYKQTAAAAGGLYGSSRFTDADPLLYIQCQADGSVRVRHRDDVAVNLQLDNIPMTTGVWRIAMFRRSALAATNQFTNRVDNEIKVATDPGIGATTLDTNVVAAITQTGVASSFFPGKLRHILVYNTALTDTDADRVFRYLRELWPSI